MKNNYSALRGKIIRQILLIAVLAPLLWLLIQYLLIDGLFQAAFAEWFVHFCQNLFNISYSEGVNMYHQLFRSNRSVWLSTGLIFLLLLAFYLVLSRMTRYFNEVSAGIEQLVEESDGEIVLSPEMDFIAARLNEIKARLERREREARETEQRKNDLVVDLAHDIKTPLTSVIGYLNLLDEAPEMPAEQKAKYIGVALEKANRLEQLVDEFFEITRFNLQAIELNRDKVNLTFMLQQMADEFNPIAAAQGKQVTAQVEEGLTVWADADQLARVFNNILKNALSYSFDHSVITIRAAQEGDRVVIIFSNPGPLIPTHQLKQIFEKFFRLDGSRASHSGGAGLGLAIAKEIVAAHGGEISAESSEQATNFRVCLPARATEAPHPNPRAIVRKS